MMKHWDITSDPARLREVRLELEHFAQGIGMSVEASHAVGLVLNEALANVIRHGYDGAVDKPIRVTAEKGDAELKVVIRDWAKPFDPATIKARREDELKPGGLGMICIRKLMDGFRYERLSDGMQLTMSKKIA
jgi:anti-sigma regulatory factor (Ser/Thr protein kinase)